MRRRKRRIMAGWFKAQWLPNLRGAGHEVIMSAAHARTMGRNTRLCYPACHGTWPQGKVERGGRGVRQRTEGRQVCNKVRGFKQGS